MIPSEKASIHESGGPVYPKKGRGLSGKEAMNGLRDERGREEYCSSYMDDMVSATRAYTPAPILVPASLHNFTRRLEAARESEGVTDPEFMGGSCEGS